MSQVYPLKNGATWFTSENGKYIIRSAGRTFDERNIELIKVGEKGLRSGNVWYIHQDIHGREWVLTDKGACIYNSKFPSKLPFKWLRGVGEDEFLATEDGKLAKYDLQNRLTMIPMPEGVTRINELKNTGYQLLLATN
ncbi:two-component system sensor histidine kinase/response regulator, hybrid (one-component system), partial [human gut metagenome]